MLTVTLRLQRGGFTAHLWVTTGLEEVLAVGLDPTEASVCRTGKFHGLSSLIVTNSVKFYLTHWPLMTVVF